MTTLNKNTQVAILIPSKNRPDFIIRQLNYYSKVASPHPVYIGDASTGEELTKLKKALDKYKNKIQVHYYYLPELNIGATMEYLSRQTQEKYSCHIGDDDFQIPPSLTQCAEFLENHNDYVSAHGYAVALRVQDAGVFGKITKIKDYPQPEIETVTALERLFQFFHNYYVALYSVTRTEVIKKAWTESLKIQDKSLSFEVLPCALSIVAGKSKLIECLSFIRQIHKGHFLVPDNFDWICQDIWGRDYNIFKKIIIEEIVKTDNKPLPEIEKKLKQTFWFFLKKELEREYHEKFPSLKPKKIPLKTRLAIKFPFLKPWYRRLKKYFNQKRWIHAEVLDIQSPFFHDFQIVKKIIEENF